MGVCSVKVSTCSYRPILVPCGLDGFDYQVDPYVGCEHFCYYCYVLKQAETDWSKEILIHSDIVTQLNEEIQGISPQKIYMGYYSDPYQPCEVKHRQTRQVLELFVEKGFSASILTKSDLVCRDVDILSKMDGANVSVSVAFNDNDVRQRFEASTIDTESRINSLVTLQEAGISTSALICPVLPFITDVAPLINQLATCTDVIWIYGLGIENRSYRNWHNIQSILKDHYPLLKPKIEEVIFNKDHAYWTNLRKELLEIQKDSQLNLKIHL
jgi:DNA repair photolyase